MRAGKRILGALLCLMLLWGCSAPAEEPPTAVPTEATRPSSPPETQPPTLPEETQAPTVPEETQRPTQPEEIQPVVQEARRIQDGFAVYLNRGDISYPMGDGDVFSKNTVHTTQQLVIESAEPVSSLYLVWDTIPGKYTLEYDGGSISCGQNNFFHEYVTLPEPVTQLRFVFREHVEPTLCDLFGYGEGSAPSDVQVWLPPCEEADILVFPTHADDDTLFFGSLIAYYSIQRELTVQTAFMVRHVSFTPERNHERLNGLWAMGVRHYPILGTAPDTGTYDFQEAMGIYAKSNILQWQVDQIRRFRPLVVIGHDLAGEYGNGGHKVNAHFLTQAISAAADPTQFPCSAQKYGTWETPKLYLHLYAKNRIYLDINTPMDKDPLGRTPLEVADDATDCHVSQIGSVRYLRGTYGYGKCMDSSLYGLYFTRVGLDSTADIMDHIDPAFWRGR